MILDVGLVGFAQLATEVESQPGAIVFRGKKRFEQLFDLFIGNPRAVIQHIK